MATILEVKGNDINIEVEKLSMSLTKLGCRGTFNKRFLISFFKQQNLDLILLREVLFSKISK